MDLENIDLEAALENTTGLKQLVVNYIGNRLMAEEEVTVDMAVEVFAAEFPEFLMAIAEENFLRGYQQALDDLAPENNSNE
jgi:predicted double-glycine peptidase